MEINKESIVELLKGKALDLLPPEAHSLLLGLFSDGLQGLMDAAVLNNIDKIPKVLRDIVSPYLLEIDWNSVPKKIGNLFNSFFKEGGEGLVSTVSRLFSGINLSNIDIGGFLSGILPKFDGIGGLFKSIASGNFGGITKLLSDFGGIDIMSLIPGSGIIKTASTIFGVLFGEGDILGRLFGNGGFGITTILDAVGVSSAITGLIAPILGLFGLGGGKKSACPCDPKCRKTDHFVTEKGEELLDEKKCATVISNSSTSYFSDGGAPDPSKTNGNLLSEAFGLVSTALGGNIIPANILNLTAAILEIPRLNNLGQQTESAQNADWPDFMNELSYSMKTIEHGFKVTDNNITGAEKILRVLIDGQIFDDLFEKKRDDVVLQTLEDTAMAVKEMYGMVLALDRTKKGLSAVGTMPSAAVKKMIKSHAALKRTRKVTWLQHAKKIKDFIELAMKLWKALQPGAKASDIAKLRGGFDQNPELATPFSAEILEQGTERFGADFYQDMTRLVHSENDSEIADIFNKISLKANEGRDNLPASPPAYHQAYETTLNRIIKDKLKAQADTPGNSPSQYSYDGSPISSDAARQPVTSTDLQRIAAETGLSDYNTLVQKLLEEQESASQRNQNC